MASSKDPLIAINYVNLADILRDLKYYMKKIRRENGFDLSGPEQPWGEFTAAKGGSYHYNYYQDRQVEALLDSYAQHRKGKGYNSINTLLASRPTQLGRIKGLLERSTHDEIEESVANETTRLIFTIAQLLLEENGVFLKSLHPLVSSSSLSSKDKISSDEKDSQTTSGHSSRKVSTSKLPTKSKPSTTKKGRSYNVRDRHHDTSTGTAKGRDKEVQLKSHRYIKE